MEGRQWGEGEGEGKGEVVGRAEVRLTVCLYTRPAGAFLAISGL